MNYRILLSGIPLGVFYLLTRVSDPWVAVLGGFVASAIVYWYARKDRLIGTLTAFSFLVVFVSALIGIVFNSEKAYLAAGPVSDFLFVGLYIGSIVIGKPLIGGIVRELMPKYAGHVPINAPVFVWLTVAWAVWDLLHGGIRLWMLSEMSIGEYIVWSRLAFWPFSSAMIGGTAWLAMREGKRHRVPGEEVVDVAQAGQAAVLAPTE